jgi:hypothetical protein
MRAIDKNMDNGFKLQATRFRLFIMAERLAACGLWFEASEQINTND